MRGSCSEVTRIDFFLTKLSLALLANFTSTVNFLSPAENRARQLKLRMNHPTADQVCLPLQMLHGYSSAREIILGVVRLLVAEKRMEKVVLLDSL